MPERVGFISTRFGGTDGVSLESAKWAEVLWYDEHVSFWYGGLSDRNPDVTLCVPEAFFSNPENLWLSERMWGRTERSQLVSRRILDLAEYLKCTLHEFHQRFDLSMMVIENAISIPMHVPLGVAIAWFLSETHVPAIAHHHDFYWERERFSVSAVYDYLDMAFPVRNPQLRHAVINQNAQEELSWRKGVPSVLVPNVLNFEEAPPSIDAYSKDVREAIGLKPDDIMILQPTRVVPRKGIEHAIKLVEMLGDPRCKLVISHEAGDEGLEYMTRLQELAAESNVDMRFFNTRIGEIRHLDTYGQKMYTLWDLYPHADLITYPSLYEGFGNALLEAVYFRIPLLLNRYSIWTRDIEPKGFRIPVMEGFITQDVVAEVRRLLEDKGYRHETTEHNYALAKRFYSYRVLQSLLRNMIGQFSGM
jgi:glycosyltransferase involved in cell wall biosynthesis